MIRPDYRAYSSSNELMHSAKGTTWENHKYLKKVDGRYIYKALLKKPNISVKKVSSETKEIKEAKKDVKDAEKIFDSAVKKLKTVKLRLYANISSNNLDFLNRLIKSSKTTIINAQKEVDQTQERLKYLQSKGFPKMLIARKR